MSHRATNSQQSAGNGLIRKGHQANATRRRSVGAARSYLLARAVPSTMATSSCGAMGATTHATMKLGLRARTRRADGSVRAQQASFGFDLSGSHSAHDSAITDYYAQPLTHSLAPSLRHTPHERACACVCVCVLWTVLFGLHFSHSFILRVAQPACRGVRPRLATVAASYLTRGELAT